MSAPLIWLIVALCLLGAEMLLGTIYLLAVFVGALAGAAAAHLGCGLTAQCSCAGVLTVLGVICFWFLKNRSGKSGARRDDDDLDAGQRVEVREVGADGSAVVTYRGARWRAEGAEGPLTAGVRYIERIEGTTLILRDKR